MIFCVEKGSTIETVAMNMVIYANNYSCSMTATFNGISLVAKPAVNPYLEAFSVVSCYWRGLMEQRGLASLPSDGISHDTSRSKREQEKVLVKALSELDTLDFSRWTECIAWLERIMDIEIDPFTAGRIFGTFTNKGGFTPQPCFEYNVKRPALFTRNLIEEILYCLVPKADHVRIIIPGMMYLSKIKDWREKFGRLNL